MEEERNRPVFAFVYKISGGIGSITNVISYDSITKELLRNNAVLKKLSDEEEKSLINTFSDNGFFEADRYSYPPGNVSDAFKYELIATWQLKGAFIRWYTGSVGVPEGILKISSEIDNIAS
jgi:hypothetical protein